MIFILGVRMVYTGPVRPAGVFCCAVRVYSEPVPVGPSCQPPMAPGDPIAGPILMNGVANPFWVYGRLLRSVPTRLDPCTESSCVNVILVENCPGRMFTVFDDDCV